MPFRSKRTRALSLNLLSLSLILLGGHAAFSMPTTRVRSSALDASGRIEQRVAHLPDDLKKQGNNERVTADLGLLSADSKTLAVPFLAERPALNALGLDDISSVFTREAASELLRRVGESADTAWDGFNMDISRKYALFTSISYCSNASVIQAWKCTRCEKLPAFQVQDVVFDHKWDLLGYVGYLPEDDAIVVAFRGTDSHSWTNWIENLRSWRQNRMWPVPEAPHAMIHAGFFNLWAKSDLAANVTAAIATLRAAHPTAGLYVTGHSMGAAIAQICALDVKFKLGIEKVYSFTFGSPRVGNADFHLLFEQQMEESWRFTHNRDVVPSLPPTFIGYHHVAREIWTIDVEPLIPGEVPDFIALMCDTSGEDPSCHNSACMLGLCTSVADHLTYLQHHMYRTPSECDM